MASVEDIEGVGEAFAQKLRGIGIKTTRGLLKMGASPEGRKMVAEKTAISDHLILKWVNHADLFRIKGIGGEYAELLEAAGVDTVVELAQRNVENLHAKLVAANAEKKLVRKLPSAMQVGKWVEQAKALPRGVTY